MEKKTFTSLPLDKLQYMLDLIDVMRHRTTNVYVMQEINKQIDEFEKEYNVSIINEWLNVYYEES